MRYSIDPHDLVLTGGYSSPLGGTARIGGLRHRGFSKTDTAAASFVDDDHDHVVIEDINTSDDNVTQRKDRICTSSSALPHWRFDSEEAENRAVVHPRTAHALCQRAQKVAAKTATPPAYPISASVDAAFVRQSAWDTDSSERISQVGDGIREEGEGYDRDGLFSPPDRAHQLAVEAAGSRALPTLNTRAVSLDSELDTPPPSASSARRALSGALFACERVPPAGVQTRDRVWGDDRRTVNII